MRLILLLSLFLMSCSTAVAPAHPATPPAVPELKQAPPKGMVVPGDPVIVYVPRIIFDTEVSDDSAQNLITLIAQVEGRHPTAIVLELDTPGGDLAAAMKIAKAIESAKAPVYCVVDGSADSAGFYILQSCTRRLATQRSVLLAHEAAVSAEKFGGKEQAWRSVADMLRATNVGERWFCCHRLTSPARCRSRMMGRDWWMSPDEALKAGALDAVIDDERPWLAHLRQTGKL